MVNPFLLINWDEASMLFSVPFYMEGGIVCGRADQSVVAYWWGSVLTITISRILLGVSITSKFCFSVKSI